MYVDGDMILNPQWTARAVPFMECKGEDSIELSYERLSQYGLY